MNQVTLEFTKFTNFNSAKVMEESTFGYRIYDDYQNDYNNTFDSIEEVIETITKENVIEFLDKNHVGYHESVVNHAKGLFFNGEWVTYSGECEESDDNEDDKINIELGANPEMEFRKFQTRDFGDGTFSVIYNHDDPDDGDTIVFESIESINLSYEDATKKARSLELLYKYKYLDVDVNDASKWLKLDTI